MDFGTTWALFNGVVVVMYDPSSSKYLVWDSTTVQTGCEFRGRSIMGGFSNWPAAWITAFAKLAEDDSTISHSMSLGDNWVMWSPIGEGGLGSPWWLFSSLADDLTSNGRDDDEYYKLRHLLARNDWGFMPMPFQNDVLRVEPLGKAVMVYGEDGICALYPTVVGDVATFGLRRIRGLDRVGIKGRSAIAVYGGDGSDDSGEHRFVDTKNRLWSIKTDLQPKK